MSEWSANSGRSERDGTCRVRSRRGFVPGLWVARPPAGAVVGATAGVDQRAGPSRRRARRAARRHGPGGVYRLCPPLQSRVRRVVARLRRFVREHAALFRALPTHARALAERLVETHGLAGASVAELGSGPGHFLSMLCEAGVAVATGFDPSYDAARLGAPTNSAVSVSTELFPARRLPSGGDGLLATRARAPRVARRRARSASSCRRGLPRCRVHRGAEWRPDAA